MQSLSPPSVSWDRVSRLILGSQSWSRRTLLQELGPPPFDTIVPDIDERAIAADSPRALVVAIARAKARALLGRPDVAAVCAAQRESEPGKKTLLICGDAVVTHKGAVLNKPADAGDARRMLRGYADAPATTVSAAVVVDVATGLCCQAVDEAEVYFRALPDAVVDRVIADGALQSAGGLRIEHEAVQPFVECVVGDVSAVMGFSLPAVARLVGRVVAGGGERLDACASGGGAGAGE